MRKRSSDELHIFHHLPSVTVIITQKMPQAGHTASMTYRFYTRVKGSFRISNRICRYGLNSSVPVQDQRVTVNIVIVLVFHKPSKNFSSGRARVSFPRTILPRGVRLGNNIDCVAVNLLLKQTNNQGQSHTPIQTQRSWAVSVVKTDARLYRQYESKDLRFYNMAIK